MMKAKWRVQYDGQAASWIVYQGRVRVRDYFPTEEAALVAARHLNAGGTVETIPDSVSG
jgi:hypothetical protein